MTILSPLMKCGTRLFIRPTYGVSISLWDYKKSLNIPKRTLSRTTLGSYEAYVLYNVRISRVESVMSLRAGKMVREQRNERKKCVGRRKILVVLQTTEFSLVSGRASLRGIQKSEARLFIKTQIVLFFLFFNFWRTQNSSCLLLYLWHTYHPGDINVPNVNKL